MIKNQIKRILELPMTLTASWRHLPNFIMIGAQKSGTTSLFSYLTEHPEVLENPRKYKELYFFNKHYSRGLDYYRHYFPMKWLTGLVGEATATYFYSPEVAKRVSDCLPEVKLILILRDPVARAISHYYHHVKRGREARALNEAFAQSYLALFEQGSFENDGFTYRYLNNGCYARHLETWRQYFGDDRFSVHAAEDMFERPQEVYDHVCDFLGIERIAMQEFTVRNKGVEREKTCEVENRLSEFYRPHVEELYASPLIRFRWKRFC